VSEVVFKDDACTIERRENVFGAVWFDISDGVREVSVPSRVFMQIIGGDLWDRLATKATDSKEALEGKR
jgi:hypothetical protein